MFQEDGEGKVHGRLNASWKISSLAVNGQSFLVIDGYLLNPVNQFVNNLPRMNVGRVIFLASSAAQTLAWRRREETNQ